MSRTTSATIEGLESRQLFAHNILDFGAMTGSSDNSGAIQRALNEAASSTDKQVLVPAGQFRYSTAITVPAGVELMGQSDFGGTGTRSELKSTAAEDANIKLTGNGPKLRKLYITGVLNAGRSTKDSSVLVYVSGASNYYIERNEIYGGASVGIKNDRGANNGAINSNKVHDTKADGIHTTHASHHITVSNNTVQRAGDDLIAVVSYNNDGQGFGTCYSINITGNNCTGGGNNGRGITVIGGDTITIDNNAISGTPMAGITIASEGTRYQTYGCNTITVTKNTISGSNTTNTSSHGGILVVGRSGFTVNNVTIGSSTDSTKKNTITNSTGEGINVGSSTTGIKILGNTIDTTTKDGVQVNASAGTQVIGNTIKKTGRFGIHFGSGMTGAVKVNNNALTDINRNRASSIRVIGFESSSTFSSLEIKSNVYNETDTSLDVEWFIFRPNYTGSTVTVSGNSTTTGEGSNPSTI